MKKIISSGIFAVLFSSCSLASHPDNILSCHRGSENLTAPCLSGNWELTIEGFSMQPNNSDLDYGNIFSLALTQSPELVDGHFVSNYKNADPEYRGGFHLGLAYDFANSSNDLQLNWTYFNQNYKTNLNFPAGEQLSTMFGVIIFTNNDFGQVGVDTLNLDQQTSFKYSAVDLDLGQFVNAGCRAKLRLFAGLRLAYIENNLQNFVTVTEPNNLLPPGENENHLTEKANSKFNGIGPKLGIDTSYNLFCGFSIVASASGSFLAGKIKPVSSILVTSGPNETDPVPVHASLDFGTKNAAKVVPAWDAKLGIHYVGKMYQSLVSLELGYKFITYVNSLERLYPNALFLFGGDGPAQINNRLAQDFSLQGPYLALSIRC